MSLSLSGKMAIVVEGGVMFKGRVNDCYIANLKLSTANRILMRIGALKATNFRQLDKKLSDYPWELFLFSGVLPRINVSSSRSRLYHKKAINEQSISSYFNIFYDFLSLFLNFYAPLNRD